MRLGGSYIYRASKAAALNLGRNLAADLRSDGIAVGIYHPGWVQTDMGGSSADITVDQAAEGLINRFEDLAIEKQDVLKPGTGKRIPISDCEVVLRVGFKLVQVASQMPED